MFFLYISNIDISFTKENDLTWRNYTTTEILSITQRAKFIVKKKLTKLALDENVKTFVVFVTILLAMIIYPNKKIQVSLLLADKILSEICTQYWIDVNVFLYDLAII